MKARIRDLPETLRPRERLLAAGPAALSDQELLAILLRSGKRGENAVEAAGKVLSQAGGPGRLAMLGVAHLRKAHGLGAVQAMTVSAAFELGRRVGRPESGRRKFPGPEAVKSYLRESHAHDAQEITGVLLLDAKNRLLKDLPCYRGTLDRAMVEPREILKNALLEDAAAIILFHNHPSGDPTPSPEDIEFTRRLSRAAESMGIRFVDHMIVGREGIFSLAERGIL